MASIPKIQNLPRQISTLAIRTKTPEDADLVAPLYQIKSSDDQLATILERIDSLWSEANATIHREEGKPDLQRQNLQTMEPRIRRDLGTMRAFLTASEAASRRNVFTFFSEQPAAAAAADQALGIINELCDAVRPYCQPVTWRLFETLRSQVQKLMLTAGFGASLPDLDRLPGNAAAVFREPALQPGLRLAPAQEESRSEDELDRLIREYSSQADSAPAPSHGLASAAAQQGAVALGAAATGSHVAPPVASGPAPSPRPTPAQLPPSAPSVSATAPAPSGAIPVRQSETSPVRARSASTPALLSPTLAGQKTNAATPLAPHMERWFALRQRDARPTGQLSPRASQGERKNPERPRGKPSKNAPPAKEVVGFAAAQMRWFAGTPGEFAELCQDNADVARFLKCTLFLNKPWQPDMVVKVGQLREHIEKINEYFLVNSKLALEQTAAARELTLALENRFTSLCAGKLHDREQVVLFFARNLNWCCHKILGRAFQSLLVREKMNPRAVQNSPAQEVVVAETRVTADPAFRAPLATAPRQTMVSTRFSARVPRSDPGSPRANLSAPVSPRQGKAAIESPRAVAEGDTLTKTTATGRGRSVQGEHRRRQWSETSNLYERTTQLGGIPQAATTRSRSASEPVSPPAGKATARPFPRPLLLPELPLEKTFLSDRNEMENDSATGNRERTTS